MNIGSYRPGLDATQLDRSNNGVIKDELNDETIDNDSIDHGENIESDDEQNVVFSSAQSKHSNVVGKRSVAGPSASRNKR